jgi:branched-chain amino acid transport system ATP-binding protein
MIEAAGLTYRVGSRELVADVSARFEAGQVHLLIGPNGAGKSTLFNLISGQFAPTSGDILLNGQSIAGVPPYLINRRGLSRSFQITNLFPRMSVAENLRIAVMGHHGYRFTLFRPVANLRRVSSRVDEHLEKLRLQHRRNDMAGDLAYSEQRALEIGIALAGGADVLMLDEPTAGMSRSETDETVELIRKVTAGKALIVVEHDVGVVFGLADRISVLVYGQVIATDSPDNIRRNEAVQEAYLGAAQHGEAAR